MDFVKLSEQRFTAKKFDVNKKIPCQQKDSS